MDAVIRHVDYFAGYSDDAIKKIAESGCNAERILTQMDNYAKDFTEDLTAGQLKRLDDILEQGITQEQFEVLLKHGKQLDDYTDEIVTLWRNYEGNSDDFLKLVDEFGDEFVEAFQENGDEAVKKCSELLRGEYDRIVFELAQQIPDSYKANLKCVEFADALQQLIEKEGICGERIYIQSETDYIVSDKYGTISYNGRHEAIKIGNVIYDNLNPLGVDYYEWKVDLGITDYPMIFELQRELIGVK